MTRRDIDDAINAIARKQHGVFSIAQLEAVGGSERMARSRRRAGHWHRRAHGVLVTAGSPPTWKQQLMVAVLAAGDGAVVSHRAAAALWRLDGFPTGMVEIAVPHKYKRPGVRTHQMSAVLPADIALIDGIPVTSPARTLIDVAWYVDPPTFEITFESARRKGLVTVARLRWRFTELPTRGRAGTATVRRFLARYDATAAVSRSELETRFDLLVESAGLPPARRQVRVRLPDGRELELDRFWPQFDVGVELDGGIAHEGRAALRRDLRRQNMLVLSGRMPLRFTWDDVVHDGDDVIAILRAAMAAAAGNPVEAAVA